MRGPLWPPMAPYGTCPASRTHFARFAAQTSSVARCIRQPPGASSVPKENAAGRAAPRRTPWGNAVEGFGKSQGWIGASIRRKEDGRLLTGAGTYVDDVALPD